MMPTMAASARKRVGVLICGGDTSAGRFRCEAHGAAYEAIMEPSVDSQDAVFAFLADPKTHGLNAPVRRIDTAGAVVFLAEDHVYKVKRAAKFPFMDLSTLEKRRAACHAEIAVNRDNAPQIYRESLPIVRRGEGFALGGDGEPVEWAVHLNRFDENMTLDRLA